MRLTADTDLAPWRIVAIEATRDVPELLPHLAVVSLRAAAIGQVAGLERETVDCLAVAGLLHDIGRTPAHRDTGFHPVDGARLAANHGALRVARLVAHHTGARFEAEMHGIELPWPWSPALEHDALMLADLTTGPDGRVLSLSQRRADIEGHYGAGSVEVQALHAFWQDAIAASARLDPAGRLVALGPTG